MQNEMRISYENMGTSSYQVITFPMDSGLIGYQLEMMISNEISHLLPVSRRMLNGETAIYYNISSRIKLSQILDRRKLKREELIHLVNGVRKAIQDGRDYQLSEECLVMDPDYIYVVPDTCSPAFLYLPVENISGGSIRELLISLVMQGKIEMSSDNFIQVMLEVLNREPFSLEELASCLNRYNKPDRSEAVQPQISFRNQQEKFGSFQSRVAEIQNEPVKAQPETAEPEKFVEPDRNQAQSIPENISKSKPGLPGKPTGRKAEKNKKVKEKRQKKPAVSDSGQDNEFDSEKAKKKFLLPQAGVMVVVAALISFGAFTGPNGGIAVNNVLAVVLAIAVVEVILYREIYVNGKNGKKSTSKKSAKPKKKPESGQVRPELPKETAHQAVRPEVPVKEKPEVKASVPDMNQRLQNNYSFKPDYQTPSYPNVSNYGNMAETELSSETELWDSDGNAEVYLEYYVNGIMNRIMLNKPSTLIGRLQSQVDFAVSNPKVGKVHAEFLNQNGAIYVIDQNSKNGTYINRGGQRINSNVPYPLNDNDKISLADSEFTLRCGSR